MFTAIIDLYGSIDCWHLVEPFYYKSIAEGDIQLYRSNGLGEDDNRIFSEETKYEVVKDILRKGCRGWNAIFLLSTQNTTVNPLKWRLSNQLYEIHKNFLEDFRQRNIYPKDIYFVVLDPLKRRDGQEPLDRNAKVAWQLDRYGYLEGDCMDYSQEIFSEAHYKHLDSAWGSIDLSKAGPINEPRQEFRDDLEKRRKDVMVALEGVMFRFRHKSSGDVSGQKETQGAQVSSRGESPAHNENIPEYQALYIKTFEEDIKREFIDKMNNRLKPPLDGLDEFRPSDLFRTILKEKLGIGSGIVTAKIVRFIIPEGQEYLKQQSMVSLSFLLMLLAKAEGYGLSLSEGAVYKGELVLREGQMEDILSKYMYCLKQTYGELDRNGAYEDPIELPRYNSSDENISSTERPAIKNIAYKLLKVFRCLGDENGVSELGRKAVEGAAFHDKKIQDGLEDCSEQFHSALLRPADSLMQKESNLRRYFDDREQDYKGAWERVINRGYKDKRPLKEFENELFEIQKDARDKTLLRVPVKAWVKSLLVMMAYFTVPYYLLQRVKLFTIPNFLYSLLCTGIAVGLFALVSMTYLTLKKESANKALNKMHDFYVNFCGDRNDLLEKFLSHIKNVYRLLSIGAMIRQAHVLVRGEREKACLRKYHRSAVNKHLQIGRTLWMSFYGGTPRGYKDIEKKPMDLAKDVLENSIYSPLYCVREASTEEKFEVLIGSIRSSTKDREGFPVEQVTFEKDRVYSL